MVATSISNRSLSILHRFTATTVRFAITRVYTAPIGRRDNTHHNATATKTSPTPRRASPTATPTPALRAAEAVGYPEAHLMNDGRAAPRTGIRRLDTLRKQRLEPQTPLRRRMSRRALRRKRDADEEPLCRDLRRGGTRVLSSRAWWSCSRFELDLRRITSSRADTRHLAAVVWRRRLYVFLLSVANGGRR